MQKQQILKRNKNCILNDFNLLLDSALDVDPQLRSLPRGVDLPRKLEYNLNIPKLRALILQTNDLGK